MMKVFHLYLFYFIYAYFYYYSRTLGHYKKPLVIGFPGYLLSPQDWEMQHKIDFTAPSLWNKMKCFTILFINAIEEILIQEVFRPNLFIILKPILEQVKMSLIYCWS